MPICRRFRRVRLMWFLRARAIRRWSLLIFSAALASSPFRPAPLSHQDWMIALVALCTWQTVHCGFFPPQRLFSLHQEQIAQGTERLSAKISRKIHGLTHAAWR